LVRGRFTSDVLEGIAAVLAVRGNPHRAARLFGAADTVRQETGVVRYAADRGSYGQDVAAVRTRLGEPASAVAWAEGRTMSLEQAIGYALEEP
jgi:hypothetical protein